MASLILAARYSKLCQDQHHNYAQFDYLLTTNVNATEPTLQYAGQEAYTTVPFLQVKEKCLHTFTRPALNLHRIQQSFDQIVSN